VSTIKFEKGKFYKTRDGEKAECFHTSVGGDEAILFVVERIGDYFATCPDGVYSTRGCESPNDIISEWPEERVVWVFRDGRSGLIGVSIEYQFAIDWIGGPSGRHPQDSLTRVVIQDGHIDKE